MPIDPQTALGLTLPTRQFTWGESDIQRYRRAVGQHPRQTGILPTFAMTAPGVFGVASPEFYHPEPPEIRFPGVTLSLATLLQLEQRLTVSRPLPLAGSATCHTETVGIDVAETGTTLVQRTTLTAPNETSLVSGTNHILARYEGGPHTTVGDTTSAPIPIPDHPADFHVETPTSIRQALWYQECIPGSSLRGNVHTDTAYAQAAGFPGPILQGVCTYGMVCAALVETVLDSRVELIQTYQARFRGVVFPGESLLTRIWRRAEGWVFLTTVPERAGKPVMIGQLGNH